MLAEFRYRLIPVPGEERFVVLCREIFFERKGFKPAVDLRRHLNSRR
jgi:hypothetical protein